MKEKQQNSTHYANQFVDDDNDDANPDRPAFEMQIITV